MMICLFSLKGKSRPFCHYTRKDVKYVDWPNLGVVNLRAPKSENRWESAVKHS